MLCTDQQNHILSKKDLNKKVVQSALNQEPKLHQQLHLDKIPLHSAGTLKYELLGLYFLKFVSQLHSAFKAQYLCAQQPHIFLTHSVSITQLDLSGHLSVLSITLEQTVRWAEVRTELLHYTGPQEVLVRTAALSQEGDELIQKSHYAEDSIQPKCSELRTISETVNNNLRAKKDHLLKARELHHRLERVRRQLHTCPH